MAIELYSKATLDTLLAAKLADAPSDGSNYGRKDGAWFAIAPGAAAWGAITGTVTDQTDLTTYLSGAYYPLSGNPSGFLTSVPGKSVYTLTGSYTLASGDANNIVYCPTGAGGGFNLSLTIPDDATYSFPIGTMITLCVDNSASGTQIDFVQGNPGGPAPILVGPIVAGGIGSTTSGHFYITKIAADRWLLS